MLLVRVTMPLTAIKHPMSSGLRSRMTLVSFKLKGATCMAQLSINSSGPTQDGIGRLAADQISDKL